MKQNGRNSRTNLLCSFLVFTAIVGLFCVSFASAANDTEQSGTSPNITPTVTPTLTPELSLQYSMQSVLLVICMIILLGAIFALILWWSNRLDQTGYLGTMYHETIEEIEWGRIKNIYREKYDKREYYDEIIRDTEWLKKYPKPVLDPSVELKKIEIEEKKRTAYDIYDPYAPIEQSSAPNVVQSAESIPKLTPDEKKKDDEYLQALTAWNREIEKEENKRYNADLIEGKKRAQERADDASKINLSVFRGKGTEFVLEFTTVVVIIFAAVILGILKILDTQQIGTLLAAIAGYVLGRATTRTKDGEVSTTPPTNIVDIINAVKGTAGSSQQAAGAESLKGTAGGSQPGTAGTGQQGTGASGTPSGPQGKS